MACSLTAVNLTNDDLLLIETSVKHFSEILFAIEIFSFQKMHLRLSSAKNYSTLNMWTSRDSFPYLWFHGIRGKILHINLNISLRIP